MQTIHIRRCSRRRRRHFVPLSNGIILYLMKTKIQWEQENNLIRIKMNFYHTKIEQKLKNEND